ncbi:nucleoporin-domain-containing protein [Massarina eburnea CBS 473.64]|uniref:Nucleoporin-domain-containing protein n=1 Tax=Massarina eburnea CBS 473.64 TaxID=1395130 RepID=A0A6A6RPU8_9PLEO|nr:nucleoporin-domain-containing protein [Massarina eburnea CBS 473.64]
MALNMPATPQRPTPGAFFNTPARPPMFRPSSAAPPQQPPPALAAAPVDTPIQRAARTINQMLDKDNRFPALEAYIGQGSSGDYELPTTDAWQPFQKLRTYQHPESVFDQVNEMQMNTRMGLFAEINHAYVFVDNQLYLWDYTAPNPTLVGFEEQPNSITFVKLVKPRENVFVEAIKWLLVVGTATDIQLIAVECQAGPEGVHGLTMYRTGMAVSTKGSVTSIVGSAKTGRIFFGLADTEDVFELMYQQEERWFSNRCSKINHDANYYNKSLAMVPFMSFSSRIGIQQMAIDDSRRLLYTLSSNSTIKVYHMRSPNALENVITRPLGSIKVMCSHIIRHAAVMDNMRIVGIDAISSPEAEHMSLIAITSTGVRLYLSTTSGGWMSESTNAPTSMAVRHIRFPPNPMTEANAQSAAAGAQMQPYQNGQMVGYNSSFLVQTVGGSRYAPGSFFCIVETPNQENHTLFASAAHSGQFVNPQEAPRYTEAGQKMVLNGKVQDIGEVTAPFSARDQPTGFGNELAVQFDKPASEYAVLTHFGVETVRRRRLVDVFASIIKHGGGPEGVDSEVRKFLKQYGLAETASTALAVACGQGFEVGPDSRIAKVTDPEVLEYARKAFIEYGGRAQLTESAAVEGLSVDNVRASPRHDGIAMYVARLVRSIWDTPIIKETVKPTGIVLESKHSTAKLQEVQRSLIQLQSFLDQNKSFIDGLAGPEALGRVASRQEEVELQGENRALTSLLQVINNIVEGIAFTLVLFEERIEDIIVLLSEESRQIVRKLSYHGLFASTQGKHIARDLVKAIVNHSIAKGSNVESVAEALRRKCGSFCSSDDVVIFKAQENLKKAADVGANAERGRVLLNDSLRLFEQVAKSLSSENLTTAVDRYIELEFYAGAVRLALKVAQEVDRGNKALSWIRDSKPEHDARRAYYDARTSCYTLIFKVIEAVDGSIHAQGAITQESVITQITRRKHEAYEQINNSDDEVFQNHLYDWYIAKGWADRLLEINSPFVVEYLRQSSETNPDYADLLWRYYAHYSDFLSAADVQFQLAKSPATFELPLEKRIEYLSRAKANASTRMNGFTDAGVRNRQSRQELLRNISDHLDIANIQDDLLQKLRKETRLSDQRRADVVNELDGPIQALDALYHNYADQAGYYDICLYIYHSADYRDIPAVRNTWTNLIEQAHRDAVEQGHTAPWEMVALAVETIGRRVNLNENVFPVNIILQILLQYHVIYYTTDSEVLRAAAPADNNLLLCSSFTWPVEVFIKLDAPFELIIATLEAMWYAQEDPFRTRANRKLLIKWTVYTIEQWRDVSRRQGVLFGGAENAIGLAECMRVMRGSGELRAPEDAEWVERARTMGDLVDGLAR